MTPTGIEPATFRFVAQHLNHCVNAVPIYAVRAYIYPTGRESATAIDISWLEGNSIQSCLRQVGVTVSIMPDTADTLIWAPGDGWRYHPKHVEQFTDINKLYIVTSCWIIIDTYYAMHGPLNIKLSDLFLWESLLSNMGESHSSSIRDQ